MQKIVWIGERYFVQSLKDCGWEHVYFHYLAEYGVFSWQELVSLAGFEPDVLVVADRSFPPFVLGMENFPCLTVWYSVDSHIHSWHQFYAQAFDVCLVSLKDNMGSFQNFFLPPDRFLWSPPHAKSEDLPKPSSPILHECLFVGTDNSDTMPKRHEFLKKLRELVPGFNALSGNYRQLFPQAKVLVNQAERGDLNFRVFEGLACGMPLVTPHVGHGLDELFEGGAHLLFYEPDDAGDAAAKIKFLLDRPELRRQIADAGLAEVNEHHRSIHRAQAFTKHINTVAGTDIDSLIAARKRLAPAIRAQCLSVPYLLWGNELADPEWKKAFLAAARGNFGLYGISQ